MEIPVFAVEQLGLAAEVVCWEIDQMGQASSMVLLKMRVCLWYINLDLEFS